MKNLKVVADGVAADGEINIYAVGDEYAACDVAVIPDNDLPISQRDNYARRIVACVNACDGVDVETLEQAVSVGGVKIIKTPAFDEIVRRAGQRDNLLAVIAQCVEHMEWSTSEGENAYKAAREAIARAKGGAAPAVNYLEWLESMHTLHGAVEILYVVDGYHLTQTYDDATVGKPVWGATLSEAIDKATAAGWKPMTRGGAR